MKLASKNKWLTGIQRGNLIFFDLSSKISNRTVVFRRFRSSTNDEDTPEVPNNFLRGTGRMGLRLSTSG